MLIRIFAAVFVIFAVSGCGQKEYYEAQAEISRQRTHETASISAGLAALANAVSRQEPLAPAVSAADGAGDAQQQLLTQFEVMDTHTGDLAAKMPIYAQKEQQQKGSNGWDAFAAYLAAQQKSEAMKQLFEMAEKAYLRPYQQIEAPYNPEETLKEAVRQTPLGIAVWSLKSIGKAGIAGARGDTTANMDRGSTMSQGGIGGTGSSDISKITKTTTEITEAAE